MTFLYFNSLQNSCVKFSYPRDQKRQRTVSCKQQWKSKVSCWYLFRCNSLPYNFNFVFKCGVSMIFLFLTKNYEILWKFWNLKIESYDFLRKRSTFLNVTISYEAKNWILRNLKFISIRNSYTLYLYVTVVNLMIVVPSRLLPGWNYCSSIYMLD